MGHSAKMRHRRRRRQGWQQRQVESAASREKAKLLSQLGKSESELSKKELNLLRARVKR